MNNSALELKRRKAKELRYKKPIAKDLNLDSIRETLWDIQSECYDVSWYFDTDNDSLLNSLIGDDDEAYEFKMMFGDLSAEVDQLIEDLNDTWVPECYDILFVAAGAEDKFGGLLGYDTYEQDYFPIDCSVAWAEDEAKKKLMTMKKEELIAAMRQCFNIHSAYIGLTYRYDCLKASMDVLRESNTSYLKEIKAIDELYAESVDKGINYWEREKNARKWDAATGNLPQEVWIC